MVAVAQLVEPRIVDPVVVGSIPIGHPTKMTIFDRIRELNLPLGNYVVIGGVMEAHGIRSARDVDIVVNDELFEELKKRGWKRKWFFWRMVGAFRCKVLKNGKGAEAFSNYKYKKYAPDTDELIRKAEMINGLPFLPLDELAKFKRELA